LDNKYAGAIASLVVDRDNYRQKFNDWFRSQGFDALIAPVSTVPAPKINTTNRVGALAVSTFLYNVLDWPVGVVPVTKVQKGDNMEASRWKGREGYSKMFMEEVYGKGKVYDQIVEDGEGLPVGVQVRASKDIADILGSRFLEKW
jgi:hypothetical protein